MESNDQGPPGEQANLISDQPGTASPTPSDSGPDPALYDSDRQSSVFKEELQELWRRRDLVVQLVTRDLKARYKRHVLGALWSMLSPLLMMSVLTLIFAFRFKIGAIEYAAYVLPGVVLWRFFVQTSSGCMSQLIGAAPLIGSVYFPRTAVGISVIGAGVINLLLSMIPLAILMSVAGVPVGVSLVIVPLAIILASMFSLGLGLFLSILAIRFRDTVDVYSAISFLWYFLTPILYPIDILSPEVHAWVLLNPMYHIVQVFRTPLYTGEFPPLHTVQIATAAAVGALLLGWTFFCSRANEVAYRV